MYHVLSYPRLPADYVKRRHGVKGCRLVFFCSDLSGKIPYLSGLEVLGGGTEEARNVNLSALGGLSLASMAFQIIRQGKFCQLALPSPV